MPRPKKTTIFLEKNVDEKLKHFKKVFDTVVEEDISYNDYVNTVVSIGLDSMLRTIIPSDQEWPILQTAFEAHYSQMCELIADLWEKDLQSVEDARERIKKDIDGYI